MMKSIIVTIEMFLADDFPGWVICSLIDADGKEWRFEEKVPVVSLEALTKHSTYPCIGYVECEIISEEKTEKGLIYTVDTSEPWGIESTCGNSTFRVVAQQLVCS